jgi:hypothetical protein
MRSGSGKSAISASIARDCKDARILSAQFFINRKNVDTTNPKSYFPSIARQLADRYPGSEVATAIHNAWKKMPSLVDVISADQAMKLFRVDVVVVASKMDPKTPVVVVIDGSDESEPSSFKASGNYEDMHLPESPIPQRESHHIQQNQRRDSKAVCTSELRRVRQAFLSSARKIKVLKVRLFATAVALST